MARRFCFCIDLYCREKYIVYAVDTTCREQHFYAVWHFWNFNWNLNVKFTVVESVFMRGVYEGCIAHPPRQPNETEGAWTSITSDGNDKQLEPSGRRYMARCLNELVRLNQRPTEGARANESHPVEGEAKPNSKVTETGAHRDSRRSKLVWWGCGIIYRTLSILQPVRD